MGKPSLNSGFPSPTSSSLHPSTPSLVSISPAVKPLSQADGIRSSSSRKQPGKRRTLSCLPCRQHKLKCDRHVPCHSCTRYRREDQCRQNPPPSSVMDGLSRFTPSIAPVADAHDSSNFHHDSVNRPVGSFAQSLPSSSSTPRPTTSSAHPPPTAAPLPPPPHPPPPPAPVSTAVPPSPIANSMTGNWKTGLVTEPTGAHWQQQQQQQQFNAVSLAGTSVLPHSVPFLVSAGQSPAHQADVAAFWKDQLMSVLPLRAQSDLLVAYYIDHMDWVYHPFHIPSFYKAYSTFWDTDIKDVSLIWLSLLYTIISCGALYVPLNEAAAVGLDKSNLRNMAHVWHSASRQALHAGGFEAKPCLIQLETFLVTQLYWLATRNVETMNSCLGQAVRNAQALGLDKDLPSANPLEKQVRRQIWWELFNCDAFQSVCLARTPLINTSPSKVPFPLNCNDNDVTETSVHPRPMDEPTETSGIILRAKVFIVFRKLFVNDSEYLSSYEYIQSIDSELEEVMSNFPWYFQTESCQALLPNREFIVWQYHIIYSCICTQRIRMHRPFLQQQISASWAACAKAAKEVLSVYKILRTPDIERLRRSQKFYVQAYQIFSAAVAQAAFLLVEQSFPVETIRNDIEMVISDLNLGGMDGMGVSTMADGKKILMKMLDMYDRRGRREPLEPESLVPEISAVFGGEQTTRKYLKRCDINYVLNGDPTPNQDRGGARTVHDTAATNTQNPYEYPTQPQVPSALSEFLEAYYGTQLDVTPIMNSDDWGSFIPGQAFNL